MGRSSLDDMQGLVRLFRKRKIMELKGLLAALKVGSTRTVIRRLSVIGYVVSCSHAGRFYTLKTIPEFDQNGLWRHIDVLFSCHGTLKETVRRLVEESNAGFFHRELESCLQLRVHNALADLVNRQLLRRGLLSGNYLYLSADEDRAKRQLDARSPLGGDDAPPSKGFSPVLVIEVLLEVIHSAKAHASAEAVAQRLQARGVTVSTDQIGEILRHHGVEKKTARSRSTRSHS